MVSRPRYLQQMLTTVRGRCKAVDERGRASVSVLGRRSSVCNAVDRLLFAFASCVAFQIDWINDSSEALLVVFLTMHPSTVLSVSRKW